MPRPGQGQDARGDAARPCRTTRLARFLDAHGRLRAWPKRPGDRDSAAAYLAGRFSPGTRYDEAHVNDLLRRWHTFDDWALLRRELCDRGLLRRDDAGSWYERV